MSAKYSVAMARAALSAALSVGGFEVGAVTQTRLRLYDMTFGTSSAPANFQNLWQIQRYTVVGTATAVVPDPLDQADPASFFTAGENYTIEPTLTAGALMFSVGLNQQATYRWVAAPGSEIVVPAVAGNGLALRTPTVGFAATGNAILLVEQG